MIRIHIDTKPLRSQLAGVQKQIPFATATALNDLAFQAMRAENAAMSTVFAHPRPFTQHAAQVERKATRSSLNAIVSLRPAQARYLEPYETGGEHALPGAGMLVPVDAKLDPYGQLPKGAVKRYSGNPKVFVGTLRGITGFWLRLKGDKLKLLLRFGVNKPVTKHLDFVKRAVALVEAQAPAAMQAAVAKALATMRK